jgi:hypothetical protein
MFDATKIQTGLLGLVGIRQPFDPEYQRIDAQNQLSESGLFLDDIPYYKTQFYIDTQDYENIDDVDLNEDLRNVQRASIVSVCQRVFNNVSYLDRNFLYQYATNRKTPESTLVNGFIGFKIKPSVIKNVAFKITDVRLEFDGLGDVEIVLFNSNLNTPMFTQTVTVTDTVQTVTLDWTVNNTAGDYKGEYFFGYIYDGTLTPFERDYRDGNIMNDLSELCIDKVYVQGATPSTLFDLDAWKYLSENTGLNPDITVYEDYTDLILQNTHLFARALQLQWAITVMQGYVSTTRSNRVERLSKETILQTIQQIEGSSDKSPVKVTGLNSVLAGEIAQLSKEVDDLKRGYFGGALKVQTLR